MFVVMRLWPRAASRPAAAARPRPRPPLAAGQQGAPAQAEPARLVVPMAARQLALSVADELAGLVCGVEGRAHHLIETAPNRGQLPASAEALLSAVQRLRTLHSKLVAVGRGRAAEPGTTSVALAVATLGEQLQQLQLGLELRWEPPPRLPEIAASPAAVHDALLFLSAALLRAERGATNLSIACEPCFASDEPRLQLELALEWSAGVPLPVTPTAGDPNLALDLEAADQLITSHGGELAIRHLPGRSVRAVVRWPMARSVAPLAVPEPEATLPPAAAAPPRESPAPAPSAPGAPAPHLRPWHDYGGALVLESDPSVRAMLANELKATGRAVFACADGASVRSFLEATPDRFELLIVDDPRRLDGGDPLGAAIRRRAPQLKVFVLAASPPPVVEDLPPLHHIRKPFGVHELRAALASVLAAG